jgi:histone arginine demethylase JMJD6
MTSAWNTSLQGYKRWVLFPPHLPKSLLMGSQYLARGQDSEAINYFAYALPEIIKAEGRANLGII